MMEDRILLKKLILHALLNSTLFTIGGYFGIGLERSNVIISCTEFGSLLCLLLSKYL